MPVIPVVISHGQTVGFVGDSTAASTTGPYAWYDGGFVDAVNAQFAPVAGGVAAFTGLPATFTGLPAKVLTGTTPPPIVVADGGTSGDVAAGLDGKINAFLAAHNPDVVFVSIGTNDVSAGTTPSAFRTSYDSVLAKIRAYRAATPIACMSIYFRGETWGTGPVWVDAGGGYPTGTNAAVDALNAQISASAAAANAVYIDTRSQFLAWEVTHNPSKVVSGVASPEGIHLAAAGKAAIVPFVMAAITVQP